MNRHIEPVVEQAVQQFASMIAKRYDIAQVIIYGSRARGDCHEDSDVDVAVILRGEPQRFLDVKLDMVDDACNVLLETGLLISPFPIWLKEWNHPEKYSNPLLLENINKEGVRL